MIFPQIQTALTPGMTLPGTSYQVKGVGLRRGEKAIIYRIPNRKTGSSNEKGITASECEKAHNELMASGQFSRSWFEGNLPAAGLEGGCNFTALGAAFVALGIARRVHGKYLLKTGSP